jgi:hypothetical protein
MVLLLPLPIRASPRNPARRPGGRSAIEDARAAIADAHHGLRHAEVRGDADALVHVYEMAQRCDASSRELAQIRRGFPALAEDLVATTRKRRRRARRAPS